MTLDTMLRLAQHSSERDDFMQTTSKAIQTGDLTEPILDAKTAYETATRLERLSGTWMNKTTSEQVSAFFAAKADVELSPPPSDCVR